mmetsp:Transcript_31352/g.88023  ORF Transcript_31352/g.88023 Transcript_31352/m.88023 type:complete len:427 (+) Transcript_31352:2-1282(+)
MLSVPTWKASSMSESTLESESSCLLLDSEDFDICRLASAGFALLLLLLCPTSTDGMSACTNGLTLFILLISGLTLSVPTWNVSSASESQPESEYAGAADSSRLASSGVALPLLPNPPSADGKSARASGLTLIDLLASGLTLSVPTRKASSAFVSMLASGFTLRAPSWKASPSSEPDSASSSASAAASCGGAHTVTSSAWQPASGGPPCPLGAGGRSAGASGLTLIALLASGLTLSVPTWKASPASESDSASSSSLPAAAAASCTGDCTVTSSGPPPPPPPPWPPGASGRSAGDGGRMLADLPAAGPRLVVPTWKTSPASDGTLDIMLASGLTLCVPTWKSPPASEPDSASSAAGAAALCGGECTVTSSGISAAFTELVVAARLGMRVAASESSSGGGPARLSVLTLPNGDSASARSPPGAPGAAAI